jgi:hypothetical protein
MSDELQQSTESVTEDTTVTSEVPPVEAPQLQLSDLLITAQVIQLASQRGAIKPEEMEAVGGAYTRMVKFLQASGALKPASEVETPAQDTPAAE